ncbi:hypothetical protein AOL_s00210g186 [Orbilia oligospora ATCC 24927]|uniref:Uncharacterized protein n=1 Tax=Arthrobotrys oligospora (strain ATCC 24927 / CBS 115.81 / DSM 1491) TaxID=756982 RepID=G1XS28_ARTOA|nr:hypothetical protein AOL_s00210g186 [Orbilia oligospora ATCC 24927]EGX44025.1 hypothetical protein AOL_s00210g186 [Orbilia oligospora ATCC 24927]
MKTLAEIQRLRLAEEAIKSLDPEPLTIRVLGKRTARSSHLARTTISTIQIPRLQNETAFSRRWSLRHALCSDTSIMALYNPESGEIFYLEQVGSIYSSDEYENVTTLEDIDRLGEEGTVWHAVYSAFIYTRSSCPFAANGYWYTKYPNHPYILMMAWIYQKMGIETMPVVLHEDLVEGRYLTTWDAVKAKGVTHLLIHGDAHHNALKKRLKNFRFNSKALAIRIQKND